MSFRNYIPIDFICSAYIWIFVLNVSLDFTKSMNRFVNWDPNIILGFKLILRIDSLIFIDRNLQYSQSLIHFLKSWSECKFTFGAQSSFARCNPESGWQLFSISSAMNSLRLAKTLQGWFCKRTFSDFVSIQNICRLFTKISRN